ncbi:hypothetical protein JOC24_005362 [Streptomyces sp. HB132]|nr:hypothetical protein [Streptomyces sp. HB132]
MVVVRGLRKHHRARESGALGEPHIQLTLGACSGSRCATAVAARPWRPRGPRRTRSAGAGW